MKAVGSISNRGKVLVHSRNEQTMVQFLPSGYNYWVKSQSWLNVRVIL